MLSVQINVLSISLYAANNLELAQENVLNNRMMSLLGFDYSSRICPCRRCLTGSIVEYSNPVRLQLYSYTPTLHSLDLAVGVI